MELIYVEAKILTLILWDILAAHGSLLELHDEYHTEKIGVDVTEPPFREINEENLFVVHNFTDVEAGLNLT